MQPLWIQGHGVLVPWVLAMSFVNMKYLLLCVILFHHVPSVSLFLCIPSIVFLDSFVWDRLVYLYASKKCLSLLIYGWLFRVCVMSICVSICVYLLMLRHALAYVVLLWAQLKNLILSLFNKAMCNLGFAPSIMYWDLEWRTQTLPT